MRKSSILLIMPDNSNLMRQFQNNLAYCGFNVLALSDTQSDKDFRYPDIKTHIYHSLCKTFLHDRSIKEELKQEWRYQKAIQFIGDRVFDYTLVIRPDLFTNKLLKQLRQHTRNSFVAYQWDGFDRFPEVRDKISFFDRFFVFDADDIIRHSNLPLLGITNFYFDNNHPRKIANKKQSAYFIGSHIDERVFPINHCAHVLTNINIGINFIINTRVRKHHQLYQNEQITFIKRTIDFSTNLENVINADILLDFVNPVHQGLSFRIFEALYYGKKLITDNPTVKDYDFYHPNNIFVWDGKDLSGLPEFLALPLQPIDPHIVEKYSFINWIKNILDIPPYQQIELPKISKPSV